MKRKRRVRFGTTGTADWFEMLILPFYLVVFPKKKIDYHPNFPHRKQNSTKSDFVQPSFAKSRKLILGLFHAHRICFMSWLDFSFPQFKEIVCSPRRRQGTTQKAFRRSLIFPPPWIFISLFFFFSLLPPLSFFFLFSLFSLLSRNTHIHIYTLFSLFLLLRFPFFPNALLDEE